ncbi:MAG: DUF3820 family protein [Bacteroidales bacterium]|nr:DUF3820 family protein [Bacteroidales bacterium]
MITLRPNQVEPIEKAIGFFRERSPKPSLIVLPTAWGKSILTAYVARSMGPDDRLLVLQPSKELLEQNLAKYYALCGEGEARAAVYSASLNSRETAPITYATIGSIKSLGATFRELGFTKMLIDEAHLYPREADSMLGGFLADSGIRHVLGITATPVKLQGGYTRDGERMTKLVMLTSSSKKGNFFRDILHVGQIEEMVRLGFWSPLRYEVPPFGGGSLLQYNSTGADFTDASLSRAYEANGGNDAVEAAIARHPERRHVLAFVPTVADALSLARSFPESEAVFGEMDPKARAAAIGRFRAGITRVLFNVRVLSTGFDYTGIDMIVLGSAISSIALYYQIVGRATRIDPAKEDALICDLAGNVDRFGRVEDIRYEKTTIWRMYGTGGRRLSGIPLWDIGTVFYEDDARRAESLLETMPFGKYKGRRIAEVPSDYLRWMLDTFEWKPANMKLRRSILATMNA